MVTSCKSFFYEIVKTYDRNKSYENGKQQNLMAISYFYYVLLFSSFGMDVTHLNTWAGVVYC